MNSESNVDFNVLFKKSYKELGINWLDDLENDDDRLLSIMKDFENWFPDLKEPNSFMILLKSITVFVQYRNILLKKNDVYDFFIMSYKFLIDHLIKKRNNTVPFTLSTYDNIVFEICNDLVVRYDKFSDNVKVQFPNLLVDILSIIFFKVDLDGRKVSLFQLKPYYESKKSLLVNGKYSYPQKDLSSILNTNIDHSGQLAGQNKNNIQISIDREFQLQKEKLLVANNDIHPSTEASRLDHSKMIEEMANKIAQIVQRDPLQVKNSLNKLPGKDIQKLYDISNNYNKVLRYGKLIELKDFKSKVESELGRSLSDKQIRHSQISIKKVQFYIEQILDKKFEPHLTHGINHVKHNFEYGYRLVGLISNSKSKNKSNISQSGILHQSSNT
ncbi:MAG TPA: hypothetical protein VFG45_13690 [Candidatus Nitrosocosmicus sp.]|jgi:hypothetical protein|uniref:hypothetical protein n=1 Tax=Candidatus Nitrosocosmicus agrestis TaxID=2563600 RepID=UPI00122E7082|nr:hypothetical protein [Candidatus Nitrosocosmicus sp. SS]KAA2283786.1 hypothetical protein F1Z66_00425 [Candidatus Nitrosocosmicus sp. SS]KAF0870162.1 hypothetical protein E5N71_01150 [Candidatus Nitrosocosmicus sp. SS]MDR4489332.1 hypothetical protein [Candidatus Nitrosocosmicus sp.]HET6591205.1 hypothetical protein [Candidatus Nitrosocosmicus sp.]